MKASPQHYDLVIGGAGLYGATLAHFAHKQGKRVLVLERGEIGGLCADSDGYSKYGIHVFHTNDYDLWQWVNSIDQFIPIHLSPLAQYEDELYSFPINKLTLHQIGYTGEIREPKGANFEEACFYALGPVLYEKFYYHYTKKMWERDPKDIPSSILSRVPARTDYNTSYYKDRYVGVPVNGFTNFIIELLEGVEVKAGDFCKEHTKYNCEKVFTGSIDEFHDFQLGPLEYRGLNFDECDPIDAMVINYTDAREYTRKVNYAYLGGPNITIKETPCDNHRMYPVPWDSLYGEYKKIKTDVCFAGRLGSYRYLNMNEVIEQAHKDSSL